MYKMVILIRTDINMGKGKMVAQGAHAAVGAALVACRERPEIFNGWQAEGAPKIAVKVSSLEDLMQLKAKAESLGLITYIVEDRGLTQVPPGTITCLAIGPGPASLIDRVTGELKLL